MHGEGVWNGDQRPQLQTLIDGVCLMGMPSNVAFWHFLSIQIVITSKLKIELPALIINHLTGINLQAGLDLDSPK